MRFKITTMNYRKNHVSLGSFDTEKEMKVRNSNY